MKKSQKEVYDRLVRGQVFLDMHADTLGAINRAEVRLELDAIVAAIPEREAARVEATTEWRSCTARLRMLRKDLRIEHLAPIVVVARAKAPHTYLGAIRLPSANASDYELIAAATDTADAIGDNRHLFLEQCFPLDFVEQLLAAADDIRAAGDDAARCRLESAEATVATAALVKRGRKLIRLLGVLVLARARRDPGLGRDWRTWMAARPTHLNQEHPCIALTEL